jgi:hypothetical protein
MPALQTCAGKDDGVVGRDGTTVVFQDEEIQSGDPAIRRLS